MPVRQGDKACHASQPLLCSPRHQSKALTVGAKPPRESSSTQPHPNHSKLGGLRQVTSQLWEFISKDCIRDEGNTSDAWSLPSRRFPSIEKH